MVASILLMLLLSSAYALFSSGYRMARDSEARLDMQKSLVTSIGLLGREITETNPTSIRYDASPPGTVFASPRNADGALSLSNSGKLSWEKVIGYYLRPDGVVIRKEWMLDPYVRQSGFPPSLGAGFSTQSIADEPLPQRAVSHGVDELIVSLNGNTATIRVSASQVDSRARKHRVSLETAVQIHN